MRSRKLTNEELEEINGAAASEKTSREDFSEEEIVDYIYEKPQTPEKKKRGRKKKENYVDPEVFKSQIVRFYKDGNLTDELGKAVHDIATRLGFMPNFINYTY